MLNIANAHYFKQTGDELKTSSRFYLTTFVRPFFSQGLLFGGPLELILALVFVPTAGAQKSYRSPLACLAQLLR